MRVYKNLAEVAGIRNPVVSIGTFDGVHLGHRTILDRLNEEAKRLKGESVLITFWPHPRMVLQPEDNSLRLLNTMEEKQRLLAKAGLQNLIILPFSKEFSRTTSDDFVREILVRQIGITKAVIGYDHHFGRNREGSLKVLQAYAPIHGFQVEETPALQIDQINISSTKIRRALEAGEVDLAKKYLGYSYLLTGAVVHGDGRGKDLGFPTANIEPEGSYKLIPQQGVYAVWVEVEGQMKKGIMNIGQRPTFSGDSVRLEVHLLDFSMDLYGKEIVVQFESYLRPEQKFTGKSELISQLKKDQEAALAVLQ